MLNDEERMKERKEGRKEGRKKERKKEIVYLIGIREVLERREIVTVVVLIDFGRRHASERVRVGRRTLEAIGSAASKTGPSLLNHGRSCCALLELK